MPTTARSDNHTVRIFVPADGGIGGLAIRGHGKILAFEHTVIEPVVGNIADQSELLPTFAVIAADPSHDQAPTLPRFVG